MKKMLEEINWTGVGVAVLVGLIAAYSVTLESLGWDGVPLYMKATVIVGAPIAAYLVTVKVLDQ